MLQRIYKYRVRIILNLLAWGFLFKASYDNTNNYNPPQGLHSAFMLHMVLYNLLFVFTSCLNTMWLMPKYFIRKKYLTYIVSFVVLLVIASVGISQYNVWIIKHFPGSTDGDFSSISISLMGTLGWIDYYLAVIPAVFLVLFLFSFGYLAQQYFQVKRQQEVIGKKQMESELNLLKSQINPHFLFNVLNSIYALSLKKSDETPEIVLKLSEILRYMLYETRQEKVSLEKEIDMIESYIDIERIRIGSHQQIAFKIQGNIDSYVIAPALLISFVENAVKHGIDSMSENAFVSIEMDIENGVLHFYCSNNYKKANAKSVGGIGLQNVQKRLGLLYPDKHQLLIKTKMLSLL